MNISDICHRLYERNYLVATSGNISARTDSGFRITPTSTRKDSIGETDIVECDFEGRAVDSEKSPSSEFAVHREIYKNRGDIDAAIHAHPHYSLACSIAGIPIKETLLPELEVYIGPIQEVPHAPPGTEELAKTLSPLLLASNTFILERHGVLILGNDLEDAFNRLEHLEHVAQVAYLANSITIR